MKSYDSLLDGDVELQKEIQEVIHRGIEEGLQREAEESIIAEQQQTVLYIVEVRFPALLEVAKQNVPLLKGRNELRQLAKQIMRAPDETFARCALNTFVE